MQFPNRYQPFSLLFAYAWIVGIFALGSSPIVHLWRPLIIALAIGVLVTVPAFLLARGNLKVQLAAGLAAMTIISTWPFVASIAILGLWRYGVSNLRSRRGQPRLDEPNVAFVVRVANGAGLVIAAVATANVVITGGLGVSAAPPMADRPMPVEDLPNIHVVLLDGYPRADTLLTDFDYDNSPFLHGLSDRGFQVVENSRSNYTKSLMTLASVLHMDYLHAVSALQEHEGSAVGQTRQLTGAINDAPATALLRERGYEIIASGAAFGETSLMSADIFMETAGLTRFEEQLSRFTWLASVFNALSPDLLPNQHRDSVRQSFAIWLETAESSRERPYFMLTHVLAPHSPFLFEADGTDRPPPQCFPADCGLWDTELAGSGMTPAEYADGVHAQMGYINDLTLQTVAKVRAADPEGVIVLFSDHGLRYDIDQPDEFFRNFVAIDMPGSIESLPDDASPVNLLPYVFNAYLDTDLPIRPYEGWLSSEKPFNVTRFEPRSR